MSNPSILTQLFTLSKAIAVQVASGCPIADEDEQKKRRNICESCDPFFDAEKYRCKECGCNLHLKIPLGTSKCPIKKW